MDAGSVVSSVEELVARQFLGVPTNAGEWLEGLAQSGSDALFTPIAVFESLYETPADYAGTAGDLWEEAYRDFEQRRRDTEAALTSRWGPSQPYSFRAEYERVLARDEGVSSLE